MESLLVLAALVFIGGPILLFFLVIGARSRVSALELRVDALQAELDNMRGPVASEGRSAVAIEMPLASANADWAEAAGSEPELKPELEPTPAPVFKPLPLPESNSVPQIFGKKAAFRRQAEAVPNVDDGVDARLGASAGYKEALSTFPAAEESPVLSDAPPLVFAPASPPAWLVHAKAWLFGGNLVAKVGLLILFLGVGFLIKYASARVSLPIELRLAGIVVADIALLLWGWRIRERRPAISLPVQGGALAILMLVTFGAFRIYHLIPGGLAFGLLFALTFFTCLLAVLQNAPWLAVFGIVGGFAAPIVTSTGDGSHIALFSYYALLNAGILAIALKRSWRLLNLLGFAFTFVIGTAWGVMRYQPENYLSAQLFLALFFAFYVAIAVLYALREAPRLKHYVDGTLVFGTPLAAFGLQYGLVQDKAFGLAFSALALGLFYMSLTLALWRRRGGSLALLVESFLALAVVFGTLAIPFALDGRWTSAAWALEGAGIVWVGLRQKQKLAWMFGVLVQLGAWVSFVASVGDMSSAVAARSNLWLGFLLLAGSGFVMAMNFRRQGGADESSPAARLFPGLATAFLAAAALWLLAGAWTELFVRDARYLETLLVLSALAVAALLGLIAKRLAWPIARFFALLPQLAAGLIFLWLLDFDAFGGDQLMGVAGDSISLFDSAFLGGLLLALAAGASSLAFSRQNDGASLRNSRLLLGWGAFWWFVVVLASANDWGVAQLASRDFFVETAYPLVHPIYGLLVALGAFGFARLAQRWQWPDLRWLAYAVWPVLAYAMWQLFGQLASTTHFLPPAQVWLALLALWLASEYLLRSGEREEWLSEEEHPRLLRALHTLRTVGPWILLWPVLQNAVTLWLQADTTAQAMLLADAGWFTVGSWARYLPAWALMACIALLIPPARAGRWPTAPIPAWYTRVLIPLGSVAAIVLVAIWNFTENGLMAPLPYLPVLNPLDLTTGFAALLGIVAWRLRADETGGESTEFPLRLLMIAAVAGYVWFNLMLLRTAAHYVDISYQFEPLFRSQFVQTMLSLVWSATALVLMRFAAGRRQRLPWLAGAALLVLVVAKLFLVDLSNVGGVERIVSFLGVGLLMLAIGYLAPFPTQSGESTEASGVSS